MATITYYRPIVCFGKTDEDTLTSPPSATATTLNFDNSGGDYAEGDLVFISESDDTEVEFMGDVISATAGGVVVRHPVQTDKSASAKIWKPTTYLWFTYGPGDSEQKEFDIGTTTEKSRGGQIYVTKLADTVEKLTLQFSEAITSDFYDYTQFIDSDRSGGIYSFSLAWWDNFRSFSRTAKVKAILPMLTSDLSFSRPDLKIASFTLGFFIETDDSYVES